MGLYQNSGATLAIGLGSLILAKLWSWELPYTETPILVFIVQSEANLPNIFFLCYLWGLSKDGMPTMVDASENGMVALVDVRSIF
jgi:hypothetical protein